MSYYCPKCDKPTGVMETRGEFRRRKCASCEYRFYTCEYEVERAPGKSVFTEKRLMYANGVGN